MTALVVAFVVVILIVIIAFWAIPYLPVDANTANLLRAVIAVAAAGYLILRLLGYL